MGNVKYLLMRRYCRGLSAEYLEPDHRLAFGNVIFYWEYFAGAFWYHLAGFAHKPLTEFVAAAHLLGMLALCVHAAPDPPAGRRAGSRPGGAGRVGAGAIRAGRRAAACRRVPAHATKAAARDGRRGRILRRRRVRCADLGRRPVPLLPRQRALQPYPGRDAHGREPGVPVPVVAHARRRAPQRAEPRRGAAFSSALRVAAGGDRAGVAFALPAGAQGNDRSAFAPLPAREFRVHILRRKATDELQEAAEALGMEQRYERALQIDANDLETMDRLAMLRFGQRRYEQALGLYRRMAEIEPGAALIHANLGATLYYLDRVDEAVRSFEHALSLEPTLETARTALDGIRKSLPREAP